MDRITDSGSVGCGSIPHGGTTLYNTIMKKVIFAIAVLFVSAAMHAQRPGMDTFIHCENANHNSNEQVLIPDIEGYVTLKGDFHIHTVFSDGSVWPSFRVEEARRNGLDIIAITDHIECRPMREYFSEKVDLDTSYEIAKGSVGGAEDLIVIHGIEISRDKPFGHMNALFIEDGDKADVPDELDALEAMLEQGAYIIWNHPGWPDDKATMYPIHEKLIAEGKIHGVEVWNEIESYPVTYDWIGEYGLHPFANSDIHSTVESLYGDRRPMTLVFAREKTHDSVKEAMFAGRILALFNNILMGKQELIAPLVKQCLTFELKKDKGDYCIYNIVNKSDIRFQIQVGDTMHQVTVHPRSSNAYIEIAKNQDVTFVNCILGTGRYHSVSQSEL